MCAVCSSRERTEGMGGMQLRFRKRGVAVQKCRLAVQSIGDCEMRCSSMPGQLGKKVGEPSFLQVTGTAPPTSLDSPAHGPPDPNPASSSLVLTHRAPHPPDPISFSLCSSAARRRAVRWRRQNDEDDGVCLVVHGLIVCNSLLLVILQLTFACPSSPQCSWETT